MSVRSKAPDLNSEASVVGANHKYSFNESLTNGILGCDSNNPGGFSSVGARVLGEVNHSPNTSGVGEVELKGRIGGVSRDQVGMSDAYNAYVSNIGLNLNSDGDLDVEMRGVDDATVTETMGMDQNEVMRTCPQNSCKVPEINLVVDLNFHPEEQICDGGIEINLPFPGGLEGNGNTSIRNSDSTISHPAQIKEVVTSEHTNDVFGIDVNAHALIPKRRARENQIEKEGDFYLYDLVWGKVRSHPWWPGQILEPSAASEKAMKYFKKDCYLIGYYGDKSFAWNEAPNIKPLRMHFTEMKQQSNVITFCHAVDAVLDEVSRRVEFGLACKCLPEDVLKEVKFQLLLNAGIQEKSTRVYGGDSISTVASFFPEKFINYLKALAESPHADRDTLEFVTARAQLLAFNRLKGYYHLPELEELNGVLGNDAKLHVSCKEENSDGTMNGESSASHSKKRKVVGSASSEQRKKRGRKPGRRGSQQTVVARDGEFVLATNPPTSEILSRLCIAAASPMEFYCSLTSIVGVLCSFRKFISMGHSKFKEETMSPGKIAAENLSKSAGSFEYEGKEDSYWSDRIIETNLHEQQVRFRPQTTAENFIDAVERDSKENTKWLLDTEDEVNGRVTELDVDNSILCVNKNNSSDEYSPTTLILNFSDLESVPSVPNLNQIFDRFGPLEESRTEVLSQSKRAKLVFKRRSDAECAFSRAGKFSIFGPSLVSYRLKYEAPKSSSAKKQKGAPKMQVQEKSVKKEAS